MEKLGWSFGSQSRAAVRIGENPDIAGMVGAAVKAGVGEAIVFGKCHTGFCFYPTKIGIMHPKLKIDMLGDMSRALKERGIKVMAYLNFGMDGEAGRRHPEWLQRNSSDEPTLITMDHYANVCPFTPYVDELLLPLVKEMLGLYPLDGLFFDTMNAFHICYCKVCRERFSQACGMEIPADKADTGWAKYGSFQSGRMYDLLDRIGDFIHEVSPDAVTLFNHAGGIVFPGKVPESIGVRLSADPPAKAPWISIYSNFLASGDYPADIFIERFYRGWGDRNGLPRMTLDHKAAPIFAYRRRFFVGDRLHPELRLAAGSNHAMQYLEALRRRMGRLMPQDDVGRAPDAVVLINEGLVFGSDMSAFGRPSERRILPIVGIHQLMLDSGWNFVLTPESNMEKWLSPERLLILPEILSISADVDTLIRKFLASGGRVLVLGNVPRLKDGSIPSWLGIRSIGEKTWQGNIYLPDWKPVGDRELTLVKGAVQRMETGSARALLFPFACYDLSLMGSGVKPPALEPDDHPLLTCNCIGKGRAYYLNAAIVSDYPEGLYEQKLWFERLLDKVSKKPRARLESKAGEVELVSYGDENEPFSWYVILNYGGTQLSMVGQHSKLVGLPPPFKIVLKIRHGKKRNLKSLKINGVAVQVPEARGGMSRIPIVTDAVWKIVKCEWC